MIYNLPFFGVGGVRFLFFVLSFVVLDIFVRERILLVGFSQLN